MIFDIFCDKIKWSIAMWCWIIWAIQTKWEHKNQIYEAKKMSQSRKVPLTKACESVLTQDKIWEMRIANLRNIARENAFIREMTEKALILDRMETCILVKKRKTIFMREMFKIDEIDRAHRREIDYADIKNIEKALSEMKLNYRGV